MIVLVLSGLIAGLIGFVAARTSKDALTFYLIGLCVSLATVAMTIG